MFEVGKKVVCIDDSVPAGMLRPKVIKGEIYTIHGLKQESCCGELSIDVGLKNDYRSTCHCRCGATIGIALPGESLWYQSKRFRPIDYDFADQVLEQIFEQELILP